MNYKEFAKENKDWIYTKWNDDTGFIEFININYYEIMFTISENGFALKSLFLSKPHEQVKAVRFLAQKPKEWFKGIKPKKKYNIVLGQDPADSQVQTAYAHSGQEFYIENDLTDYELTDKDFVFTESKLKELESKLPDRLAKIVDLAKVEVKD